jgi:hypothetical protein
MRFQLVPSSWRYVSVAEPMRCCITSVYLSLSSSVSARGGLGSVNRGRQRRALQWRQQARVSGAMAGTGCRDRITLIRLQTALKRFSLDRWCCAFTFTNSRGRLGLRVSMLRLDTQRASP